MIAPQRCPNPTCHADLSDPSVPRSKRKFRKQFTRTFRFREPVPASRPPIKAGQARWRCVVCACEWVTDLVSGRIVQGSRTPAGQPEP